MSEFNKELLDVVDEKQRESDDPLKASREVFINLINGGEPKNINPLTEMPEPTMRLYGFDSILTRSAYFGTEEELIEYLKNNKCDIPFGGICVIEYMGTMADCSDVIRQTYKDCKPHFVTAVTQDHISVYNEGRSYHQGRFVWEDRPGSLKAEYAAFKERGVVLEDDVYGKYDEFMKRLMKKLGDKN